MVFQAFSGEFGIALLPRSGYTVYSVRKEVSKMAQYVVDMQMEKQEKFYFIREKESMDIVLLPSKYLMHKKRSRISPNTIRRSAFALSYYLN